MSEFAGPIRLCAALAELGFLCLRDVITDNRQRMFEWLDGTDGWPEDDAEAQQIKSDLWQHTIEELEGR